MAFTEPVRERLIGDGRQIIARYPQPRSALLPLLHLVQSEEGYVSPDGVALCAELLELTTAEVSAVATFYTQYKRHPNGQYTVGVCINTLCAVMGGDAIFEALEEHLGIGHDETTDDGRITLERIECNAACDFAPVVMVNWEFFDNQTPSSARELCDRLRGGENVAPTRGANSVATFREVSRVLAGFLDGRADEGIGAGTPSQRGTVLAQQMGWEAPRSQRARVAAATGPAARDSAAKASGRSGTDVPAVPAGERDRAGTVAGKPPAEATGGESGGSGGTAPRPASTSDPASASDEE